MTMQSKTKIRYRYQNKFNEHNMSYTLQYNMNIMDSADIH